jgi:outer membrane cobalamin receptor
MQYTDNNILWRTNIYKNKYKNLIAYMPYSIALADSGPVNINKADITGVESSFQYSLNKAKFNASFNYADPMGYDKTNPKPNTTKKYELLRKARITANIGANYNDAFINGLELGANVNIAGKSIDYNEQYVISDNIKGYASTNVYASYKITPDISLKANVNNIFNRKKIADVYGYNKPGIEGFMQLSYTPRW